MNRVKPILISAFLFVLFDVCFLYLNKEKFSMMVTKIQRFSMKMNYFSAIICYLFLLFVLYYFILREKKSPFDAFLLGLCIYGTFETTNLAIFKNWDMQVAFMDTLWGGVLFFLTTYFTYSLL
jgi:uncharacterized membrane protein